MKMTQTAFVDSLDDCFLIYSMKLRLLRPYNLILGRRESTRRGAIGLTSRQLAVCR